MLVLGRKEGESLMVGEAEIMVVAIQGKIVRLGIRAPREVPIDRLEVRAEKDRQRAARA